MSEENQQEETEGEEQETSGQDIKPGFSSAEANLIDRADAIAKRIEAGNKRFAELVERQESAVAKSMLAGHGQAGQPVKSKDELKDEQEQALAEKLVNDFYG